MASYKELQLQKRSLKRKREAIDEQIAAIDKRIALTAEFKKRQQKNETSRLIHQLKELADCLEKAAGQNSSKEVKWLRSLASAKSICLPLRFHTHLEELSHGLSCRMAYISYVASGSSNDKTNPTDSTVITIKNLL